MSNVTGMQELKVKFDGPSHQIEDNTFINSFLHFTAIIQEISAEIDETKKIEVRINASPKPGSFEIDLIILSQSIQNVAQLFTHENLTHAKDVIGLLTGAYKIFKFLKGKSPKNIETTNNGVKIEDVKGNVTYIDNRVYKIYQNSAIEKHMSQTFETLDADNGVTGFEVIDPKNKENSVEIPKEDFADIAQSGSDKIGPTQKNETVQDALLNIIGGIDFSLKKKWEFYYKGNRIVAKINDDAFSGKIEKGEAFRLGDTLEVEMDILMEYDAIANTFVNKSYVVTKILKHNSRNDSKPPELFN